MYAAVKTIAWVVLFYIIFFMAAGIVEYVGTVKHGSIYLYRDYRHSIYATDANYAAYGLNGLGNSPKQIFILGASVPGVGFLPDRLMSRLDGYKVQNLCLGAANISEMAQVVRLIEEQVDLSSLDKSIFVFGGHFASFLENERKFGGNLTDIQKEFLRYRLYRVEGDYVRPIWGGPRVTAALKVFLKPFIFIYKIKVLATDEAGKFVRAKILSKIVVGPQFYRTSRERQFRYRGFTDDQFKLFSSLIDRLEAKGAKVVFVDMPTPSYFRNNFFIYEEYRNKAHHLWERNDIHVLDMSSFAPDDSFGDDAHPIEGARARWTDRLALFLKKEVVSP
jgi:hypothetical protein